MRVLIAYATTDGHTATIAEFAQVTLRDAGHEVVLHDCAYPPAPDPADFEACLLAGSLHMGRYQPELVDFARRNAEALNARASAFIAVSLSAAGKDPSDWEGLERCLAAFEAETGWRPRAVHHAAGAFRFTRYGFFKRLALRRIARQRGLRLDPARDHDLTDYAALTTFMREFLAAAPAKSANLKGNSQTSVIYNAAFSARR